MGCWIRIRLRNFLNIESLCFLKFLYLKEENIRFSDYIWNLRTSLCNFFLEWKFKAFFFRPSSFKIFLKIFQIFFALQEIIWCLLYYSYNTNFINTNMYNQLNLDTINEFYSYFTYLFYFLEKDFKNYFVGKNYTLVKYSSLERKQASSILKSKFNFFLSYDFFSQIQLFCHAFFKLNWFWKPKILKFVHPIRRYDAIDKQIYTHSMAIY